MNNRSYKEIIAFLEANGYVQSNIVGDDVIYVKSGWHLVCKVTLNK